MHQPLEATSRAPAAGRDSALPRPARLGLAAVAAVACLWLAWWSLLAGASRLASDYAARAGARQAAELSVSLSPTDPEGHYALANLYADSGDLARAESEYLRAISQRPRDHVLRLELGKVRERAGDAGGALEAFREAVRLAPHYAQPRWQLGQALLRAGRVEESFAELRRAAESDPAYYPNLLQTVWHASGRDPAALVRAARPATKGETLSVVRFLVKAGAAAEAMRLLRESGAEVTEEARRALVADLLAAEDFKGAFEVWSGGRGAHGSGSFFDGGFEGEVRADEEGFGWRFAREAQGVRLSLDAAEPREGARSLKVEYAGASEPSAPAVSQLVVVEPGARYRLSFSARSRELVTGGPPFVQVSPGSEKGGALAATAPLPASTNGWQDLSVEFTAPPAGAVRVALKRQPCTSSPCPAFGGLWLDAFELKRL